MFINGVSQTLNVVTAIASNAMPDVASVLYVGYSNTIYFAGYIDEFRVSKGVARWIASFTPPGIAYSTGDYVTLPDSANYAFGTGDFTIDFWFYANTHAEGKEHNFCGQWEDGANSKVWYFRTYAYLGSQYWSFFAGTSNVSFQADYTYQGTLLSPSTWYHVALVRNLDVLKLYVNGVYMAWTTIGTSIGGNSLIDYTSPLYVGARSSVLSTDLGVNGYIDDFRISKGIARWTSNFTPATSELPGDIVSSISTGNILNGNEDGWYTIISKVNMTTTANAGLVFNGDTTAANYGYRGVGGVAAAVSDSTGTSFLGMLHAGALTGNQGFAITKMYAKSGFVRLASTHCSYDVNGTTVGGAYVWGTVWNNSVDNIRSIALTAGGNAIGIGSRFIVIKSSHFTNGTPTGTIDTKNLRGSWIRVGRVKLGAAASSVTFTGLDGDRDVVYYLSAAVTAVDGTMDTIYVRPNNASGATDYGYQNLGAVATAVSAARGTYAKYQLTQAGINTAGSGTLLIYAKSGWARLAIGQATYSISGTTIGGWYTHGASWNEAPTNISSLVVFPYAGNMPIGTMLTLYALRPNG
jgi:hypothetical protein